MKRIDRLKSLVGKTINLNVKDFDELEDRELVAIGSNYIEVYDSDREKSEVFKLKDVQCFTFDNVKEETTDTSDDEDDEDDEEDD